MDPGPECHVIPVRFASRRVTSPQSRHVYSLSLSFGMPIACSSSCLNHTYIRDSRILIGGLKNHWVTHSLSPWRELRKTFLLAYHSFIQSIKHSYRNFRKDITYEKHRAGWYLRVREKKRRCRIGFRTLFEGNSFFLYPSLSTVSTRCVVFCVCALIS